MIGHISSQCSSQRLPYKCVVSAEMQDWFHQTEQEPGASSALCIPRTAHQGTGTLFSVVQKVFFLQQKSTRIWNTIGNI